MNKDTLRKMAGVLIVIRDIKQEDDKTIDMFKKYEKVSK